MYLIATFEQSLSVELVISTLLQAGIPKEQILALPLKKKPTSRTMFDTMHSSDGFSTIDLSAIFGTCFMLLGAIYGFELEWGPILWGIIGAVTGILLGVCAKLITVKKMKSSPASTSEVILMIKLLDTKRDLIEQILLNHNALGITDYRSSSPEEDRPFFASNKQG